MSEAKKQVRQPADKYIVRFKEGMRSTIKQRAAANNRTMNAEIVFLIEKGMEVTYGEKSNG